MMPFTERLVVLLVTGLLALVAQGQLSVSVGDAAGDPVPYAHVAWQPLKPGSSGGLFVVDANGKGLVPVDMATAQLGVIVRISFVGFRSLTDTVRGGDGIGIHFVLLSEELDLPEYVVTGQYAPASPERAVHRVRVIDAVQLQRMAANNLGDALRNELNIRLSQDNVLGTSMSMQGLGGQNVKLLVDGVPVIGRQDGNIDLAQIDLTGIERVEVVEGPLSVNYGTNALAGTINLITKKGGGRPATLKASAYAEHIGRLNTTVTGTRHWGKNDIVLTAGRNFFAGWDPRHPGFVDLTPSLADTNRFQQWKPREQFFGRLGYRRVGEHWDLGYKGEAMHDLITNRGMPRAPYFESAFDERYTTIRFDNSITVERRFGAGRKANAMVAHNRYARYSNLWYRDLTTLNEQLVDAATEQDTSGFTLSNIRATFAQARDSARVNFEAGMDLNLETGAGRRIGDGEEEIGDYAAFASAEYRPSRSFTLRPGLRYAYNTRYGAPFIPSLNVRWQLNDGFTLRASYANGFRAPSLKELYLLFVDVNHDIVGNTDLEAERSHNMSAALAYRHAKDKGVYTSEVSVFYNVVDDLISLAQITGTRYSYINVGEYRTAGGSMGAGWDNGHWVISCGAALTGRYDELAAATNGPFLFTSEVRASITKQWLRKGWSGSVFWKWQDRLANYAILADGNVGRSFIGSFHMADASLTKRLWSGRLALTGGCKNLLDVQSLNASLSGGAHNAGSASVPMSTGRLAFLRVELDLKRSSK
ncbi:MAG: TonB-dependent receptor [Flavobacteriales bacterium]|nr:TonB-dependent receptor [Flavobacteriales bacterium]